MSYLQDFIPHGYQILEELGHNSLGGRVTYRAQNLETGQLAAIKQFQFAIAQSNWGDYESLELEIEMLRHLKHPGIPRYLDSFPTENGFCLVQEYLDAKSLATPRSWTPQEVKEIALSILEILVYLQSHNPCVIHRDIKPENILIDDLHRVYLIDFGFARTGGGEIAASSVVKGTMGFMPPEQLFDRQLTEASDLYGLGATLICLLTGTKSVNIGNLIDEDYRVRFRHLVPPLKRGWLSWLEKLVEPKIGDRYANAAEALSALETIDIEALPKVRIDRPHLEFAATRYGEQVTQNLTVSNPIPNTLLSGRWEIAPHPNDSPDNPPWITFNPIKLESNRTICEITVDTRPLLANRLYERQIILRTNASPETCDLQLKVYTAPLPKPQLFNEFSGVRSTYLLFWTAIGWLLSSVVQSNYFVAIIPWVFLPAISAFFFVEKTVFKRSKRVKTKAEKVEIKLMKSMFVAILCGVAIGVVISLFLDRPLLGLLGTQLGVVFGGLATIHGTSSNSTRSPIEKKIRLENILSNQSSKNGWTAFGKFIFLSLCFLGILFIIMILGGMAFIFVMSALGAPLIAGGIGVGMMFLFLYMITHFFWSGLNVAVEAIANRELSHGQSPKEAINIALLIAGLGVSLGVAVRLLFAVGLGTEALNVPMVYTVIIASLAATGIPLLDANIFKPMRIIDRYRRSKQKLIQP